MWMPADHEAAIKKQLPSAGVIDSLQTILMETSCCNHLSSVSRFDMSTAICSWCFSNQSLAASDMSQTCIYSPNIDDNLGYMKIQLLEFTQVQSILWQFLPHLLFQQLRQRSAKGTLHFWAGKQNYKVTRRGKCLRKAIEHGPVEIVDLPS